jgi:hypothetical protein
MISLFPSDILDRYGLSEESARDAVSVAISRTLSLSYGVPVLVNVNGSIKITAHHKNRQVDISPVEIDQKLRRHIEYSVELELQKRQAVKEANYLAQLRGAVVYGEILAISKTGRLFVELELEEMFSKIVLLGECPLKLQPGWERPIYAAGGVYAFLITSVLPVLDQERARVRIFLSRVSQFLPALMLREKAGIDEIECVRRFPGRESWIKTEKRIPKPIINEVGKELREHLHVQVVQKSTIGPKPIKTA